MVPASVTELRKELERKKFAASIKTYERLTREHKRILGDIPSSQKIYIDHALFLKGFNRIVIGAHGPYVEFEEVQCGIPLYIKEGQEWRLYETRFHPHYLWYYPDGFPQIKIYKQIQRVKYADYIPGKYYVDIWIVSFENTGQIIPHVDIQVQFDY
jgi:hypothetical protein